MRKDHKNKKDFVIRLNQDWNFAMSCVESRESMPDKLSRLVSNPEGIETVSDTTEINDAEYAVITSKLCYSRACGECAIRDILSLVSNLNRILSYDNAYFVTLRV